MKKNITNLPIKKTLKSMFMMAFISASLLNAVSVQAAYHIANESDYTNSSGLISSRNTAYRAIEKEEKQTIVDESKIKQVSNLKIFYNGKEVKLKDGVLNYSDTTYLPFRNFGELINAKVVWLPEQGSAYKVAEISINDKVLGIPSQYRLAIKNDSYTDRNGNIAYGGSAEIIEIKSSNGTVVPSINQNGRLYLPMRFICEFFGYNVDYTQNNSLTNTNTIEIYQGERPALELNTQHVNETKWRPVGVSVGTEEQWEKFFTQKHPVTNATAIKGVYYMSTSPKGNVFTPVFDHNGDGRIGNTELLSPDANGNSILKNNTVSIEEFKTLSDSDKSYQSKQECINWYRNSVINTKPTTQGKEDGERSADKLWVWDSQLKQWVAGSGINGKGTTEVWQAKGIMGILTSGDTFVR